MPAFGYTDDASNGSGDNSWVCIERGGYFNEKLSEFDENLKRELI